MPSDPERLDGENEIRRMGALKDPRIGRPVRHHGRVWFCVEIVEEGRAARLVEPGTENEAIVPIGEIN